MFKYLSFPVIRAVLAASMPFDFPYSHLLHYKFLFLAATMTLFIIYTPAFTFAVDDRFSNCSQIVSCGDFRNIGYPFWGLSRAEYCGYPGFQLSCNDNRSLVIKILDVTYEIIRIDNQSQSLTVARTDYLDNLCPDLLFNTTLNTTLFSFAPDIHDFRLYYNCSPPTPPANDLLPIEFRCNINGTDDLLGYYMTNLTDSGGLPGDTTPVVSALLGSCENSVIVPANRASLPTFERNASIENLETVLKDGFGVIWSANNSWCKQCRDIGGHCGFNHTSTCFCQDQICDLTVNFQPGSSGKGNFVLKIAIGPAVGITGLLVISIVVICIFISRIDKKIDENVEAFIRTHGSLSPKRFKFLEVKKMTNSFAEMVGKGGFGTVYKGKLSDGRIVAVKVSSDSKGDGEDFINEVASMSRTSHVNIVTFVGFCYERTKRVLIYEFVPNGSLDSFIFDKGIPRTNCNLEMHTLYRIAVGIARGLDYLHRGCNTRILHFDIKPHNILLDEDFCPKISDFGLSKLWVKKESIISMLGARGTA